MNEPAGVTAVAPDSLCYGQNRPCEGSAAGDMFIDLQIEFGLNARGRITSTKTNARRRPMSCGSGPTLSA
jgi:hypothetical protein